MNGSFGKFLIGNGNKIMEKNNPRSGSNFDDFLKAQGMFDEVTAQAHKRAITEQPQGGRQGTAHYQGGAACPDGSLPPPA